VNSAKNPSIPATGWRPCRRATYKNGFPLRSRWILDGASEFPQGPGRSISTCRHLGGFRLRLTVETYKPTQNEDSETVTNGKRFRRVWIRARRDLDRAGGRVLGLVREQHLRILLLAAIVGVVAGLGAIAVKELISLAQSVFWGSSGDILGSVAAAPIWRIILVPCAGGLLVGPLVAGSGGGWP